MQLMDYSGRRLKLLIVDPSETEQRMIMSVLSGHNCDVALAGQVEEGLMLAMSLRPDLIVADCGLKIDGSELCRQVRRLPELIDTPFVLMSSFANTRNAGLIRLFEAGCDQVLHKPFGFSELHAAIGTALRRRACADMIPALLQSGEFALIPPENLQNLIADGRVLCFKRRDAVAVIDRDVIRGEVCADYCGPERRQSPA